MRVNNLRYAVLDQLKNCKYREFREVIELSFLLKSGVISQELDMWIEHADDACAYSGLVSSHNHGLIKEMVADQKNLYKDLLV